MVMQSNINEIKPLKWLDLNTEQSNQIYLTGDRIISKGSLVSIYGKANLWNKKQFAIQIIYVKTSVKIGIIDSASKLYTIKLQNRLLYDNKGNCWDGLEYEFN